MPTILIIETPQSYSKQPLFVKEAYIGLKLVTAGFVPLEEGPFDEDSHLVNLSEVLKKMCTHNTRAYQWLVASWGDIGDVAKTAESTIQLVFSVGCCEELPEVIN